MLPLATLVVDENISYGVVQPGHEVSDGIPMIRVKDIRNGTIDGREPLYISREVSDLHSRTILAGDEVLVTLVGTVGEAAVVREDMSGWNVARAVAVLRPAGVESGWLKLCFELPATRAYIDGALNTTVQSTLNLADLKRLPVPLPEAPFRKAVLAVMGALDDKIAANLKVESTTRSLAGLTFDRAACRLGGPGSVMKLGELSAAGALALGDGYRTKRDELTDNGYLIIRVADVEGGEVRRKGPDFVRREFAKAIGSKAGQAGDIILTTKGTVGRVAVVRDVSEGVVYSPQICFFRVYENDVVDRMFLRYWFESQEFSAQAAHRMDNSDMAPYINLADIRSLQISLPPIERQRDAAEQLSALDQQLASLLVENRRLAELRDTLLPHLMSGRLRVKNAEKQVEAVV